MHPLPSQARLWLDLRALFFACGRGGCGERLNRSNSVFPTKCSTRARLINDLKIQDPYLHLGVRRPGTNTRGYLLDTAVCTVADSDCKSSRDSPKVCTPLCIDWDAIDVVKDHDVRNSLDVAAQLIAEREREEPELRWAAGPLKMSPHDAI